MTNSGGWSDKLCYIYLLKFQATIKKYKDENKIHTA